MERIFTALITLQFLLVVLHDLIEIPGWTHASQVRRVIGARKLYIATAINAIFPGLAVGFGLWFWNRQAPGYVHTYWVTYCAITLLSAIFMWYIPYFFGTNERTRREYTEMYEGTRQVLPARGENPRPNLLHLCFHTLFVATLCLAVVIAR